MQTTEIKILRSKIIAFLASAKGGEAARSALKKHLGIDPMIHSEPFNRAVKTTKITPVYGSGEIAPGLFLSRPPVVAYRLTP